MSTNRRGSLSYDRCRRQHAAEYDAYYSTVLVSVGLKDMFTDDEPCTFKVSEPKMTTSSSTPVCPDVIFQCDRDRKGIVCEIKSSLPADDEHVVKDVGEQINKYSKIEGGWMTESGKIPEHSILLLVNRVDVKRLRRLLEEDPRLTAGVDSGVGICLSYWLQTRPPKSSMGDIILISRESGSTGCRYVDKKLDNDITIPLVSTVGRYEERKFVKSDPPDIYLIDVLYRDVFPSIAAEGDDIEVSLEYLTGVLAQYYASWSGVENEQGQVRPRWIKHALETLCKIGLATKISGGSRYKIKPALRQKNLKEFLLDKLCGADATPSQSLPGDLAGQRGDRSGEDADATPSQSKLGDFA